MFRQWGTVLIFSCAKQSASHVEFREMQGLQTPEKIQISEFWSFKELWSHKTMNFLIEIKSKIPRLNGEFISIWHFQSFTAATDHFWKFLGMIRKQCLLTWWQIMGREEPTAEQNNSQECIWLIQLHQTMPVGAVAGPWWCLSATMWSLWQLNPAEMDQALQPILQEGGDYGSPLCFSNLFAWLLSSLTPVSKCGRGHREASCSHTLQSIAETWEHTQLRAGERLFVLWVMGAVVRWATPCAELVLLPCSSLVHSLTGSFSCVS